MKKMLFLLAAMAVFIACSKDDDNEDFLVSEEQFEIYQQAYDDATDYIKKNAPKDINIVAEYIKTIQGVTDVQQMDNVLYVIVDDALKFIIDFNTYPEYEHLNVTAEEITQIIDSIDNALETNRVSGYLQTSEVFKDYLSQNQGVSAINTRSSVVKLAKKNVLIWSPWTEFDKEKDQIKTIVGNANNPNHIEVRNSIVPQSLQDCQDYDLVYLSSHGFNDGSVLISLDALSLEQQNIYLKEIIAGRVICRTALDGERTLILTDKFFDKYLPDLSNTIMWASACYLGTQDSKFMKSLFNKNVADFFASDTACTSRDIIDNFKSFYIKLMNGYSTDRAFANGLGYFNGKIRENIWDFITPKLYKFSRYGTKLVYYPKPVATGVGKRSDESKATTRSGDDATSVIVNVQLRYSNEEKEDILKVTESGICLLDMETKEVKLIPFTSNNIVSNEKKTYGDVTVSNIAASLDDLIEGHQYAYCSYTKVDGVITISDETYIFSKTGNYKLIFDLSFDMVEKRLYDDVKEWNHEKAGKTETITNNDIKYNFEISKKGDKYYLYEKSQSFLYEGQEYYLNFFGSNTQMSDYVYSEERWPYHRSYEWKCNNDNFYYRDYWISINGELGEEFIFDIKNIDSTPELLEFSFHYLGHHGDASVYYGDVSYDIDRYFILKTVDYNRIPLP